MSEVKITENSVSESLKIILVKKNMNIAQLAKLMKVSSTTMYSKFKRENFTLKDLNNISKALNLTCEISFIMKDNN